MDKVAVFIDHTNVHYRLKELRRIDSDWATFYNPLTLSEKMTGSNRELVAVNFYCTPPPPHLLKGNAEDIEKHKAQTRYYEKVKRLDKVSVFYGRLTGPPHSLQEKDLDTQMAINIVTSAMNEIYDTVVILSNDGDYASAIDAIKQLNKKSELLYFRGTCSMATRAKVNLSRRARRKYFVEML